MVTEPKVVAECWTCGHCPTGEHGLNATCIKMRHLVPLTFRLAATTPKAGRHAGHDVRPVEVKHAD